MPKVKTHSATKKRFKRVGNGKIKRSKAYKRHLLTRKTAKRKRNLRQGSYVCKSDMAAFSVLLPYKK